MSATAAFLQEFEHEAKTTRRVLESILANEEEHADDMLTFLQNP